ncbi:MAG: aminopeptidase [Cyclobacteriaceae bacterium]|nr:aminopeptidase [Cyclobacteriaceae bacterium]
MIGKILWNAKLTTQDNPIKPAMQNTWFTFYKLIFLVLSRTQVINYFCKVDFKLLETLCRINATSGDEVGMKQFLLNYVNKNSVGWVTRPQIIEGGGFQDNLMLVFGEPQTAYYAHIDSVGFTARYQNQLITIGSPDAENGDILVGEDNHGLIECAIEIDKNGNTFHDFKRTIEPGTPLTYKHNFYKSTDRVTSPYLDNRLGVFALLHLAEELENGVLVFSTYEEHGGGSVGYLASYLFSKFTISQSIIVDVTWVTEGIQLGHGPVVSLRDAYIPRRKFIRKIISHLDDSSLVYQKEVEASGGSDGSELQRSALPIDWCFIGVPVNNPHTAKEEANIFDIIRLVALLKTLSIKV